MFLEHPHGNTMVDIQWLLVHTHPAYPLSNPTILSRTPFPRLVIGSNSSIWQSWGDARSKKEKSGCVDKLPVAITEMLQNRLTTTKAEAATGQDYDSRLWDMLWVAAFTIKLADRGTETVTFAVVQPEVEPKSGQPQNVEFRLQAAYGPGNEDKPFNGPFKGVTIGFLENF